MRTQFIKRTTLAFLVSLLLASSVFAADIQVITSGAFAEALKDLACLLYTSPSPRD